MTGINSRWIWVIGDQIASSFSSLVSVIAIARVFSATEFGVFALAYAFHAFFIACGRAYFGTALSADASTVSSKSAKYTGAVKLIAIFSVPIAGSVGVLTILVTAPQGLHGVQWLLVGLVACATPLVMMQDVGRYFGIAIERPFGAFASDSWWLLAAGTLAIIGRWIPGEVVIFGWFLAIVLSWTIVMFVYRPNPGLSSAGITDRTTIPISKSALLVVAMAVGTGLIITSVASVAIGAEAAGALRAAGTLFGPLNALITFLDLAIVAMVMRRQVSDRVTVYRFVGVTALFGTILWSTALILVPADWGELILGETWNIAQPVIIITAVEYLALSVFAVLNVRVKVERRARVLFYSRLVSTFTSLMMLVIVALFQPTVQWFAACLAAGTCAGLGYTAAALSRGWWASNDLRGGGH